MTSDQITVYAEKIEHVNRKLTREEIAELVKLVVHAHFTDMGPLDDKKKIPDNFILTETDIYFIDTEFKSFFSDSITPIMNFTRFFPSTKPHDTDFFIHEINTYEHQHSKFDPLNYYDADRGHLEYYMENPPKTEYDKEFFQ